MARVARLHAADEACGRPSSSDFRIAGAWSSRLWASSNSTFRSPSASLVRVSWFPFALSFSTSSPT